MEIQLSSGAMGLGLINDTQGWSPRDAGRGGIGDLEDQRQALLTRVDLGQWSELVEMSVTSSIDVANVQARRHPEGHWRRGLLDHSTWSNWVR